MHLAPNLEKWQDTLMSYTMPNNLLQLSAKYDIDLELMETFFVACQGLLTYIDDQDGVWTPDQNDCFIIMTLTMVHMGVVPNDVAWHTTEELYGDLSDAMWANRGAIGSTVPQ